MGRRRYWKKYNNGGDDDPVVALIVIGIIILSITIYYYRQPILTGITILGILALLIAAIFGCVLLYKHIHSKKTAVKKNSEINNYNAMRQHSYHFQNRTIASTDTHCRRETTTYNRLSSIEVRECLHLMDWYQFEKIIAELYRVKGFDVTRLGGAKPDGGVDLFLEDSKDRIVVQCKHWRSWTIKDKVIRELLGTMTAERATKGILVALKGFPKEQIDYSQKHNIELIDESGIVNSIMSMKDNNRIVTIDNMLKDRKKRCPICDSDMVERIAGKGRRAGEKFWGCSRYPKCKGKYDHIP